MNEQTMICFMAFLLALNLFIDVSNQKGALRWLSLIGAACWGLVSFVYYNR